MIVGIKIFAYLLMFIDHVGAYLLPEVPIMRLIGRLSFPLFAWLIGVGVLNTKNYEKYFLRLMVFALISQYPFSLVFPGKLNVLFTLLLGAMSLKAKNIYITVVLVVISEYLKCDWGGIGVVLISLVGRCEILLYEGVRVGGYIEKPRRTLNYTFYGVYPIHFFLLNFAKRVLMTAS